jgi:CDP-diacylglycerol--serine O-phosphatidyltransferase
MARKKARSESLHIIRLFPNMVTLLGLCAGISSIRFALGERWEMAAAFIAIAALLDTFDGRLARMLNSTSDFGAQLDSLADFLNFGVAPPFILYLWTTHYVKGYGWALVLFFAVCSAIRLARFNTMLSDVSLNKKLADRYFVGVPMPAGAGLALLPMLLSFEFSLDFLSLFVIENKSYFPHFVIAFGALSAFGMASRIPTFSFRRITVHPRFASAVLIGAGITIIGFITEPWLSLCIVLLVYLVSIPIGCYRFYVLDK